MSIDSSMVAKHVAEFLGTFLLIFTIGCNVLSGNAVWGGVSIASVLMVSIYALGGISGANFNPAVSVALGISKSMGGPGMTWSTVGSYIVTQVAAGILAALTYTALFWNSFSVKPAPGFGDVRACLCELFYTFMLCFVVLNVAAAKKVQGNQYYGLAIGFVIVAGAYGAGAVSGGCFNPAVTIGINVAAMDGMWSILTYVISQVLGAALAAIIFKMVRGDEFGGEASPGSEQISEFIGTFALVATVGLNVHGKSPAGAYSIAASLMCMIYALGDVSGAHFNPAVTLAIFASGRDCGLDAKKAAKYVGTQMLGGIAAAGYFSGIHEGKSLPLGPGTAFGWVEVAIAETIFTFVLCFVVLAVAVSSATKAKTMFGLAIGACVVVGGNAIGNISGGSLNPAVSFGIGTWDNWMKPNWLIYCAWEFLGALLAAGIFRVTHAVDLAPERTTFKAEA